MTTQQARVRVIATGGSIGGIGPHRLDYILYPELGRHLTIEQSLARIPEVSQIAQVEGEDLISVGSTAIGPLEWLKICERVNQALAEDITGVVITYDTATLEELAWRFSANALRDSRSRIILVPAGYPDEVGNVPINWDFSRFHLLARKTQPNWMGCLWVRPGGVNEGIVHWPLDAA